MQPKTLLFDIEISPNLGYSWGKYEQDIISFKEPWFMLSFSAKWLGGKQTTKALCDYEGYERHKHSDKKLVEDLWELFDEADIVVAHNGNRFDIKKANARFSFYGMRPPSPYKKLDTLLIARNLYAFNSNRLDDLGEYLKLGRKLEHKGPNLWFECMDGQSKAWADMKKYNRQDVELLEKIYLHFLPFIENHPAKQMKPKKVFHGKEQCDNCGGKEFVTRGKTWFSHREYQRLQCKKCGHWQRDTQPL